MIKCVIFDCDGTLVDSEYLCNLGLELMLKDLGITEDAHSLMQRFRGWKLATIITKLTEEHKLELSDNFIPAYRKVVADLFDSKLEATANVETALRQIKLPKCVASSGPIEKIKHALQLTNLGSYFAENIFSAYVIQSWKPEPGLFLHAAEQMGFLPEQCAVIEDSLVGIEAAERAGMKPFLYDPQCDFNKGASSCIVFHDMLELPKLLSDLLVI